MAVHTEYSKIDVLAIHVYLWDCHMYIMLHANRRPTGNKWMPENNVLKAGRFRQLSFFIWRMQMQRSPHAQSN